MKKISFILIFFFPFIIYGQEGSARSKKICSDEKLAFKYEKGLTECKHYYNNPADGKNVTLSFWSKRKNCSRIFRKCNQVILGHYDFPFYFDPKDLEEKKKPVDIEQFIVAEEDEILTITGARKKRIDVPIIPFVTECKLEIFDGKKNRPDIPLTSFYTHQNNKKTDPMFCFSELKEKFFNYFKNKNRRQCTSDEMNQIVAPIKDNQRDRKRYYINIFTTLSSNQLAPISSWFFVDNTNCDLK